MYLLCKRKKYAVQSIDVLPASVSSSMINRPSKYTNRLNTIPHLVYNVAHASKADPRSSSNPKCKFNPLLPASNGSQTFKLSNCLSYNTNKKGDPSSHACMSAQGCKASRPNKYFSAQPQAYINQSFGTVPENNDFGFTKWRSAPEIITMLLTIFWPPVI